MIRLVAAWLLVIAYAAFALYLSAIVPPKPIPVVEVPLCKDPFAEFTGIPFERCDRVNRYWEI